jgi:hypothetical protein
MLSSSLLVFPPAKFLGTAIAYSPGRPSLLSHPQAQLSLLSPLPHTPSRALENPPIVLFLSFSSLLFSALASVQPLFCWPRGSFLARFYPPTYRESLSFWPIEHNASVPAFSLLNVCFLASPVDKLPVAGSSNRESLPHTSRKNTRETKNPKLPFQKKQKSPPNWLPVHQWTRFTAPSSIKPKKPRTFSSTRRRQITDHGPTLYLCGRVCMIQRMRRMLAVWVLLREYFRPGQKA